MRIKNGRLFIMSFKGVNKALAKYVYAMGIGKQMPINNKFLDIVKYLERMLMYFQNEKFKDTKGHSYLFIEGAGVLKVLWNNNNKPTIYKIAGSEIYYAGSIAIPNYMRNPNYIIKPDNYGFYLIAKVGRGDYGVGIKHIDIDGSFIENSL